MKRVVIHILFLAVRFWQMATALLRKKPDFIIIGAQKAGTTSLFHYLSLHPEIKLPRNKEVHFFDAHYEKGMLWYRSWFPFWFRKQITGEATPIYLFDERVPYRMHKDVPGAKLIVLLREPVSRAFSHYMMELRKNRESIISFDEAISKELEYIDDTERNYLKRGHYAEQLKRYFEFFDKENVLIIQSEQFFSDEQNTLNDISEFLGISLHTYQGLKPKNRHGQKTEVPQTTKDRLSGYFSSWNDELYKLLGQRYNDWD